MTGTLPNDERALIALAGALAETSVELVRLSVPGSVEETLRTRRDDVIDAMLRAPIGTIARCDTGLILDRRIEGWAWSCDDPALVAALAGQDEPGP